MAKKAKKGKKGSDKGTKNEFHSMKDEEMRKRLLDEARQRTMERIATEEQNFKLNNYKIQNRWREIMKAAKETLAHDLVEAEEQYSTALQSHLINIDTLIDLQNARLLSLETQLEEDSRMLDIEFSSERKDTRLVSSSSKTHWRLLKLQSLHAREKTEILEIMARAEHEFQEAEADARHEYSSIKDDVKNKNLEEKHALRIQLEGTVEDLWRQFQSTLNQYNSSTEERKRQFEELKQKDQKKRKRN
ncbi:hypothetical protein BASA60_002133 [Batrachochytrium salamandrivorans]|nr:hypothetical protein BASA60_002133 [Batrachochytrium salamandrivorans]